MSGEFDVVVIGGGFYGCCISLLLRERFGRVAVVETAPQLLSRASYRNQARVHNGYHYPRSFLTALRSVVNLPRFVADFAQCVDDSFEKVYAIASAGSKVNGYQFREFCRHIGAPVKPASAAITRLFSPQMIEAVFCVREFAFNAAKLRDILASRMEAKGVVRLRNEVTAVESRAGGRLRVVLADGHSVAGQAVFNCTYSRINHILRASGIQPLPMKHEITELALIEPPPDIAELGITVMDGPFFSTMPFPALGLHSLSHVRYTPHESWVDTDPGRDPYAYLDKQNPQTRQLLMVKDSQRYMPCLGKARYQQSLFEVKTVLVSNENDDGRPILLKQHSEAGNFFTVMGGKIDNVYDVLGALDSLRAFSRNAGVAG